MNDSEGNAPLSLGDVLPLSASLVSGLVGGAFGLSTLLSNLEASAEGQASPARFLMMFWPVGTVPSAFRPSGAGFNYQPSPILQPFEDAGLRQETIVLYGLGDNGLTAKGGGGSEAGVVFRSTGTHSPGTRANGGESDDAVAGGPSFDQIFLKNLASLSRPDLRVPFLNAIGDARVDSNETSAQCLSYAYQTRSVAAADGGASLTENEPLMPELSPAKLYAQVFSGFLLGGNTDVNQAEARRALQLRKSVLDYALGELGRIKQLAPASEAPRIDIHAEAIRKLEQSLSDQLAGGTTRTCVLPDEPDPSIVAPTGSKSEYGSSAGTTDESVQLEALGKLHLGVIRAAFQCDLTRVATFQWASSVNKVAFKGLMPGEPEACYRHHPTSHRIFRVDSPLDPTTRDGQVLQFLANVHTWFNQKTADVLKTFKETQDVFGNPLLDHTIVPFVTDTANLTHIRNPLPTLIFGGRALGMQGGQYLNFESATRPHNDVWLSIAQAYLPASAPDVLAALAAETFAKNAIIQQPIPGLWQRPT